MATYTIKKKFYPLLSENYILGMIEMIISKKYHILVKCESELNSKKIDIIGSSDDILMLKLSDMEDVIHEHFMTLSEKLLDDMFNE